MKLKYLMLVLLLIILPACGGATEPEAAQPTEEVSTTQEETSDTEASDTEEAESSDADQSETESSSTTEESESTEIESDTSAAESTVDTSELDKLLAEENVLKTDSGLQYIMVEEGTGAAPKSGDLVQVHYTGTLADGTKFDSSYDRGDPIAFPLGMGQVIPGWDEGIGLLTVGGKAKLIIPPELGYGEQGAGGVIPGNATLLFDVELVAIEQGPPEDPTEVDEADYTTTDSGLKYYDMEEGSGDTPTVGEVVVVHYTGWLEDNNMFDSSLTRQRPFEFAVGVGQVIPGWDEGVASMKVGGKRQLVVPAELAYGDQGAGGIIPPGATLIFDVELVDIKPAPSAPPEAPTEVDEADYTTTDSGLQYYDMEEGDGDSPIEGQRVSVHYTGWLEDGTIFDSSIPRGESFEFAVGAGQVISGWDEGVASMKVGGKRQLVIPSDLAYGDQGAGGTISPGATLIFEVELIGVE